MHALNIIATVVGLLSSTTLAAPWNPFETRSSKKGLQSIDQPESSLPDPAPLTLQYLLLGIGTQNYSCAASKKSTDAPVSVGAVAKLYDLSPLARAPFSADWLEIMLPVIPGMALAFSAATQNMVLPTQLRGMGVQPKPYGDHFFTAALVPTFDITGAVPEAQLAGKKLAFTPAPPNACPGLTGEGAVDWLYLGDTGASYGGVKSVYRLHTAGGKSAPICAGIGGDGTAGFVEVPYAAEYWFYG